MHGFDQASPDEGGIDVAGEQFGDRGILEIAGFDDPGILGQMDAMPPQLVGL
jgi:hypothetical protein